MTRHQAPARQGWPVRAATPDPADPVQVHRRASEDGISCVCEQQNARITCHLQAAGTFGTLPGHTKAWSEAV